MQSTPSFLRRFEHPAGAGQQLPQQLKLPQGEFLRQGLPAQAHLQGVQIQGQLPVAQQLGPAGRPRHAAEHRPDLPQQHRHGEGLGHIVVNLQIKAPQLLRLPVQGGEQDDGHPGLAADELAHPKAVQLGQHHVQQHQVKALPLKERRRLNAVPGQGGVVPRVPEVGHAINSCAHILTHNCEFCVENLPLSARKRKNRRGGPHGPPRRAVSAPTDAAAPPSRP